MAIAEIITIGTELLLGEIQDTNSKHLARVLRDIGIDIYRLSTVGDNQNRISFTIQEALSRADIVITTGGLGPTVDDPTRQAVATAVGVQTEFRPELWEMIKNRFTRFDRIPTENNRRQAFVPVGAIAIENPVGTAPAFVVEIGQKSIISLPGVPMEMEYLLDHFVLQYLKERYSLQETVIKARVVHTVSLGESRIDEIIGDLELLSNPTVGLLAHPGQTDIRVTAKAGSVCQADMMIAPVIKELQEKLGDFIYGYDEETLNANVGSLIREKNCAIAIIECGLGNSILGKLQALIPSRVFGDFLDADLSLETIKQMMAEYAQQDNVDLVLGIKLTSTETLQKISLSLLHGMTYNDQYRAYDGPIGNAQQWAINLGLDTIRRSLLLL